MSQSGGASSASYSNVKTSIRAYKSHDSTQYKGDIKIKTAVTASPDLETCAGGGLGAIVIACKMAVAGLGKLNMDTQKIIESTGVDADNQLQNSFSISWSYTTSSDPAL